MSVSDDEYDAQLGGPIELTPEDCDRIDAICAARQPSGSVHRHIDISIEREHKSSDKSLNPENNNEDSTSLKHNPYNIFRRARGRLSVTDIVAPSWCEIQFEYGLTQERWRKPKDRPTSFVTRRGRVITTNRGVAEDKEKALDNGKAIHMALEIELHAPQKRVYTSNKHDEWGLKLFNMLDYVQSLLTVGKCREFPVVGFIHGQLVMGIIDEICYLPSAYLGMKRNGKKASDANIEVVIPRKKTHSLHLVDCKTRMSLSLPDYSATHSSRMQLMLYKRLLDGLTSLTSPFDFGRLWRKLGINPKQPFSNFFLKQIPEVVNRHNAKCLRDFEKLWMQAIETLGVNGRREQHSKSVHDELVLVYRRRPGDLKESVSNPRHPRKESSEDLTSQQIPRAETSKSDPALAPEDEEIGRIQSLLNDLRDPALQAAILESFETSKRESGQESCSNIHQEKDISIGGIIGEIRFQHDDKALDDYVASILKWWHGEREPTGVSMEDAHRCYTCEYMSGCEWREDKLREN